MPSLGAITYGFGDFELVIEELPGGDAKRSLRFRGRAVDVEPKALRLLGILVERRGGIVRREEIAAALWRDGYQPDDVHHSIDNLVAKLRATLRRRFPPAFAYVVTERAVGVRLDPEIRVTSPLVSASEPAPSAPPPPSPEPIVLGVPAPAVAPASGSWGGVETPPGAGAVVWAVSVVFGAMVGLALVVEVAYQWPAYHAWALPTAVGVSIASALVCLRALSRVRGRSGLGRADALVVGVTIIAGWSTLVAFAIAPALPNDAIVLARFQTMAARVGWVKSVGEALFLPLLSIVPLHAVAMLTHHLRSGDTQAVRDLLSERPGSVPPAGTVYVSPRFALWVFFVVSGAWILANARLFESLTPAAYYGLFLTLDFARVALGLLTLLWVLLWYFIALNHLKRGVTSPCSE